MTDPKLPEEFCLWSTYTKIIIEAEAPYHSQLFETHGLLFDKDRDISEYVQVMALYRYNY